MIDSNKHFQDKFKALEKLKESTLKEFKAYVTDKENSLEERYRLFLRFQEYLPITEACDFFGLQIDLLWSYSERFQKVCFENVIENLEYVLIVEKDFDFNSPDNYFKNLAAEFRLDYDKDTYYRDWNKLAQVKIDFYMEEILASGYSGFIFDW